MKMLDVEEDFRRGKSGEMLMILIRLVFEGDEEGIRSSAEILEMLR